ANPPLRHSSQRLAVRRERWIDHCREGEIINGDHRDIPRTRQAEMLERAHEADEHVVVGDEDGGDPGPLTEKFPALLEGFGLPEGAIADEPVFDGQTAPPERVAVALVAGARGLK